MPPRTTTATTVGSCASRSRPSPTPDTGTGRTATTVERRVSDRRSTVVAVRPVPVSGVGDGRDRDAQDPTVVAVVVLGGIPDGYRHSGDVGKAVAAPTCAESIRHGVDDAA